MSSAMAETSSARSTNFFDLPAEIRDMIYACGREAWININQAYNKLQQPPTARVSHQMRSEALAVFYSRNKFVLDLRGWKDSKYPKLWTPADIFRAWILAIGDTNAGSLRSLTIFAANFRVVIKISSELPVRIDWRLRVNTTSAEQAERVPSSYTFKVASKRVESALRVDITDIEKRAHEEQRYLTAADLNSIKDAVANLQPFLCTRMGLGFMGALLERDEMHESGWPDTSDHKERCDDCGYLRYRKL